MATPTAILPLTLVTGNVRSNLPPVNNWNVRIGPLGVPGSLFTVRILTVAASTVAPPTLLILNTSFTLKL